MTTTTKTATKTVPKATDSATPCAECITGTIHAGLPVGSRIELFGLETYYTTGESSSNTTTTETSASTSTSTAATKKSTLDISEYDRIVVLYTDIFGLSLPNNLLLADAYARDLNSPSPSGTTSSDTLYNQEDLTKNQKKTLVLVPDFFDGDSAPLSFADVVIPVKGREQGRWKKWTGMIGHAPGMVGWLGRQGEGKSEERCLGWVGRLRKMVEGNERGKVKIGMVGICWGGKWALRVGLVENDVRIGGEDEKGTTAKDGKSADGADPDGVKKKSAKTKIPLVDAIVVLHPSRLALPRDINGLSVPTAFGWGKEDHSVPIAQMTSVKEWFEKKRDKEEKKNKSDDDNREEGGNKVVVPVMEHKVYEPGRHGFAVRGDPDDEDERRCLEESEKQVVEWFRRWL